MVLTPIFRLEQDDKKLKVIIHAPLAKLSEMEVCVEEQTFYFDSSPYYLKFDIPGSVLTDENTFDYEFINGDIHITLEKSEPGPFKDLDLITKLLITSSETKISKCLIEEVNDTVTQNQNWSLDWFSDSKNTSSSLDDVILPNSPTYGFSGSKSGLFQVESDLTHVVDLPNPDSVEIFKRSKLRTMDEEKKFLVDHYL
ncbi:unnamed protein product [Schistosoma turkestanicum]|nr:unnamed protein product [Schistosoma turkestanicum]